MKKFVIFVLVLFIFVPFAKADIFSNSNPTQEKIVYDDDKTANDKEYFGWAPVNSATSASVWKIMRITYTGNDFVLDWADGTKSYTNIWDNRAILTYE